MLHQVLQVWHDPVSVHLCSFWSLRSLLCVRGQDCKRHKPGGCPPGRRIRCPNCLILPCIMILRKISNHLELCKSVLLLRMHFPHGTGTASRNHPLLHASHAVSICLHVSSTLQCLLHIWHCHLGPCTTPGHACA